MERVRGGVRADPGPEPDGGRAGWDGAEFARLVEEARLAERVGRHGIADPGGLIGDVVGGLFGARADQEGGRFDLAPWLPEGWRMMALRRLRLHRTLLDVEVRPRVEWVTIKLAVTFGPPIALALSVRNTGAVAGVIVDEVEVAGPRAIFTVQGEHEARFFFGGTPAREAPGEPGS